MTPTTEPNQQDLRARLPRNSYYEFVHDLCRALPDPLNNIPEALARRNESAITVVAALHPANLTEAKIAALHVAATEHAMVCYRYAEQPEMQLLGKLKCLAQAASLTRQANSTLRLLQRTQALREKIEANQKTRDRAAWTEHCALNLMAEALEAPSPCERIEPRSGSMAEGSAEPEDSSTFPQDPESPQEAAEAKAPFLCGKIEPQSGSMPEGAAPAHTKDASGSPQETEPWQEPPPPPWHPAQATEPTAHDDPEQVSRTAPMSRVLKRLHDPDDDLDPAVRAAQPTIPDRTTMKSNDLVQAFIAAEHVVPDRTTILIDDMTQALIAARTAAPPQNE